MHCGIEASADEICMAVNASATPGILVEPAEWIARLRRSLVLFGFGDLIPILKFALPPSTGTLSPILGATIETASLSSGPTRHGL
jgi:hypothetical protein